MRSDFTFWQRIETRSNDIDSMGHVNSVVYFAYFENIRIEYFRAIGLHKLKVKGTFGPAVISQTCNYREQLFHPSAIELGCRCVSIGERSFTVEYEAYLENTDTLVCMGTTVMVWVDYTVPKAIPVPEELRREIEAVEGHAVFAVD